MSRDVYLVGSVPMVNASGSSCKVSAALGSLPDGETANEPTGSLGSNRYAEHPAFAKSGEFFRIHATRTRRERYMFRAGIERQRDRLAAVQKIQWRSARTKGGWDEKNLDADGELPRGRQSFWTCSICAEP